MAMGGVFEQGRVAAGVDDAGCVARDDGVAFGQEGKKGHGHVEAACAVGLECLGPMLRFGFHEVR